MPAIPGLSAQLARLDRAVARLGADGVADALRRRLAELPPGEREAFVHVFEVDAPGPDPSLLADVAAVVDDLPRAVDELADDRWRRRRHRWDEWFADRDADESPVVAMVDDLYRRLGERFLAGEAATAISGYRRLFDAAASTVDDPAGIHVRGRADTAREAFARLVHGLLIDPAQTPAHRAVAAVDALTAYCHAVDVPTVAEVIDARPDGLGNDRATLMAWRDACENAARAHLSWEGRYVHGWLVDLTSRFDGPDGLGRLATDDTYPQRVDTYDAWLNQLETAGRLDDAIAAANDGIETLTSPLDRARLADRSARLHRSAADHSAACEAGLRAVREAPTLWRLRRVLDDAEVAGCIDTAATELVAAVDGHGHAPPLVHVTVRVLAGRLDDLADAATIDGARGRVWDDRRASAAVVTGALLLACRDVQDDLATSLCGRLVDAIDRSGPEDEHRRVLTELRRQRRSGEPEPEPGVLGPRIRAALVATAPDVARLAEARQVVAATAEAVLGAKQRADYGTVAAMVVALAQTTEAVDGTRADEVIAEFDARYRRFSAFRAELRDATRPVV